MNIEKFELQQMLNTASELGANRVLVKNGLVKTEISKSEAYRRYGRKSVDRWIRMGEIEPIKRGAAIRLNVTELDLLSKTNILTNKLLEAS